MCPHDIKCWCLWHLAMLEASREGRPFSFFHAGVGYVVKDKIKERSRDKSPAFARRLKALKLRKAERREFKQSEVDFIFSSV